MQVFILIFIKGGAGEVFYAEIMEATSEISDIIQNQKIVAKKIVSGEKDLFVQV